MKALELASELNSLCVAEFAWPYLDAAANELRRLHAESEMRRNLAQDAMQANKRLAEVNAELVREMERYLPVIAKAEDSAVWSELTDGTGIATANGYRAAIAKAKEQQ